MRKIFLTITLTIAVFLNNGAAQIINDSQSTLINKNNNPLKGLRKAEHGDIDRSKGFKLDPKTTPMFHEDLSLIQGDDFSKIMTSGDYKPEPYIDSNKEIKAFVLVKLTDVEKEQRKTKQNQKMIEFIGKEAFPLKGLRKAERRDIGLKISFNPYKTPMYYENLTLIQFDDFNKIMMSGDYEPEAYIDSNKEIKAFVLRKLTDIEKEQRNTKQNQKRSEFVGKEAFPFSVTDIYGNNFSLENLKGKVIVLNFWFIECKPCVMEIPELNDLVDKYQGKDVVFLGFSSNDKLKIESFLTTTNFKYNVIADSREVAGNFKVNSYPTHIIIDKNSIISYYITGLGPNTIKDLDNTIESLLK